MKFILSGATGFIGDILIPEILRQHDEAVLLSRDPGKVIAKHGGAAVTARWDGRNTGSWQDVLDGADVVINLAGESVGNGKWTAGRKEEILKSRVEATRAIVHAIGAVRRKPALLINGSAVGYYGDAGDEMLSEDAEPGRDFLADVCRRWEEEARAAAAYGVRVVHLRMGIVVGKGSEVLRRMAFPFRVFVGGPVGPGTQWFPWIHAEDVAGIMRFLVARPDLNGPVNAVAPGQVTMRQFCKALGSTLRRPCWLPVPAPLLRLAVGEMSAMLTTGQRVVPRALLQSGYSFRFPQLSGALADALL